MTTLTDELKPYKADIDLSLRWFKNARECVLSGKLQAAAHCLEKGIAILDRIEAEVLKGRKP